MSRSDNKKSLLLFPNDGQPRWELSPQQEIVKEHIQNKLLNGEYKTVPATCLCGAAQDEYEILALKDRYGLFHKVVLCTKCSLIFNASPLDRDSAAKFYDADYRDLYNLGPIDESSAFQKQYVRGSVIYDLASRFIGTRKINVLDIGCGGGGYLDVFHKKGHDVVGIDLDSRHFSYGSTKGIEKLYKLSLPQFIEQHQQPFGLVIMSHVLEHVQDPLGHLNMIHDLLALDGLFYLEVPNFDPKDKTDFLTELQNAHNWYFDEFVMRNLLVSCGFEVLEFVKPFHMGFLLRKAKSRLPGRAFSQQVNPQVVSEKLRMLRMANRRHQLNEPLIQLRCFLGKIKRILVWLWVKK